MAGKTLSVGRPQDEEDHERHDQIRDEEKAGQAGEVVDFLDWYYKSYHWPTFNIADSAITIGVIMLFIQMVRKGSLTFS